MPQQLQKRTEEQIFIDDELILVVKRDLLFPQGAWAGIKAAPFTSFVHIINKQKEFMPRSHMETDPTYKQIIPYLIFEYQNRYFLMQRKSQTSEQRLKEQFSLGIGGHIRKEDLTSNSIIDWAHREFYEEIDYSGSFTVKSLGILNDDSNPVGQVHVGFVMLLTGDSFNIRIKSELKSGVLLPLEELKDFYPRMENWSKIVYDFLAKTK